MIVIFSYKVEPLNFFTPAIYFSQKSSKYLNRVGIGYDIGLSNTSYDSLSDSDYNITYRYHGITLLGSHEWEINKNHAIGIFLKLVFRWISGNVSPTTLGISKFNEFNHWGSTIGLIYRFNVGF